MLHGADSCVTPLGIVMQTTDRTGASNVQPQEFEWVAGTKIVTKSDEKQRDEELRKKAALEREKELAEFQKDKKYREDLAKKVRADVEADNKRRKELRRK
ncbi:hypothetical protein AVEN_251246-1 [Araneus ventricosus]|uniref:Uncharacterized protein n=1 Tax=Araneus ventricosus TaxID=182803 RepID=A0A4Y2LK49_ARAVE|nr:hypothetical protein AVEN_251246-1 [Araneus ventricosus]